MESAVTSKGRATIPKPIRDHLGIKPGDRVKFFIRPDGSVVLLPTLPALVLKGLIEHHGSPISLDEMEEAIRTGPGGERF